MALLKSMGRNPTGARLSRIRNSDNYRNGAFQNIEPTPMEMKPSAIPGLLWKFISKPKGTHPTVNVPVVLTDLNNLDADDAPVFVWFGHSSYLIRSQSFNVLVDPVFSGYTSPVPFIGKAFKGSDPYSVEDLPYIDLLIITHDHYDHLDYQTMLQLKPKVKKIVTSLGVGEHLEFRGYDRDKIIEPDWWESAFINNRVNITAAPARHFPGRTMKRAQTLWSSFVLSLYGYNIFIGGDSGYSNQFKIIGERFGPFDTAFLDGAQYNDLWSLIHMTPEQTIVAAHDLKARTLLPVHWGKFAMAYHPWNEPAKRLRNASRNSSLNIVTPKIGEPLKLNATKVFEEWWNI